MTPSKKNRLIAVDLDASIGPGPSPEADHERRVAIYDLLEENSFGLLNGKEGPYRLQLSTQDGRVLFDIYNEREEKLAIIGLSMSPFRVIVKDYFQICESYYEAIRHSTPSQIETIDMARRGLHNEGSEILKERLNGKVDIDFDTARRLFTLVCVLHWRGQSMSRQSVKRFGDKDMLQHINLARFLFGEMITFRREARQDLPVPGDLPNAVLFACTQNVIRSPMAAAIMKHFYGHRVYVASAGVRPGEADPFIATVLDEISIDLGKHRPHNFADLEDSSFDLAISLSPEAHHWALELTRTMAIETEYWPTMDPSAVYGSREQILDSYRMVRDGLVNRIRAKFGPLSARGV